MPDPRLPAVGRWRDWPVLLVLLGILGGCAQQPASVSEGVMHVVLCWLKEPGDAEHRREIIRISRGFRDIPGVLDVRVGVPLASERPIVDDSFDVGLSLWFATPDDLRTYLAHPRHRQAVRDLIAPRTRRILVYDIHVDGG